ncbi:hypothetical protein K7T73_04340 [Bacillus badius]|uniref:hypothetical protein n=1 Tax=Bacillus badius TaxID=1455 RepID=UPI001CBFEDF6|nr:hypothetical protein [Bacillus badius]UAT31468.1 hypothetical protein K7T73_04340 [Bacillus badius]
MGGYGSGLYGNGTGIGKTAVEHCRSIDIRRWQREKILSPGRSFTWVWYDESGEPTATISVIPERNRLILAYSVNGESIRTNVYLSNTKTGFGQRKWFHCPKCGQRIAILYIKGKYFRCRQCHNLNYRSSQLSGDPLYYHEQLEKICRKLDGRYDPLSYSPPSKPKGMHQRTYLQMKIKYMQLAEKRDQAFIAGASRILKRK